MKGVILMKSTLNSNSMHNLLNNLENDLELLTPIEPEILHKHNINAYTHKRHMKNMDNTSNQIEPEFDLIRFNDEKSSSDSTIAFGIVLYIFPLTYQYRLKSRIALLLKNS